MPNSRSGLQMASFSRSVKLLLFLLALVLVACSPLVDADQPAIHSDLALTLRPDQSIGQTFVAQHGGLQGVSVQVQVDAEPDSAIVLHLREDPTSDVNLRSVTLPVSALDPSGAAHFAFDPLRDSHARYYYAVWTLQSLDPASIVALAAGPAGAYRNGAAYVDQEPQEAQVSFSLSYDPILTGLELLGALVTWSGWLLVCIGLFILPGFVLLRVVRGTDDLSLGTVVGVAAGIGMSLYPILLVWTNVMGLSLGPLNAWLPLLAGVVGGAVILWRVRLSVAISAVRAWWASEACLPDLVLLLLLAMLFGARLLVIRALDAPLWGDSVQHATIVQLMLDHGGLFSSWEPYTPFASFTVHFGFHSIIAAFSWLTGVSASQATLVMGQLLNGLAILTLYPLAQRLTDGNRWAGVGAVLVGGLLSPMPAFYVNWGRYAQLAGQAILPVALWLLIDVVERVKADRCRGIFSGILAALTLGGATLAYYRMPFFYAAFVIAWSLSRIKWFWQLGRQRLWVIWRVAFVGFAAVALLLPWALRVMSQSGLVRSVSAGMTASFPLQRVLDDYAVWLQIENYVPRLLVFFALLSVVYDLLRKRSAGLVVLGWFVIVASLVAGQLINLPGGNMMQSFAVVIAVYIPVSLLVGGLIGRLASSLRSQPAIARWGGLAILGVLSLVGVRDRLSVLDTSYLMVTRPDMIAAQWMDEALLEDAVVLVEGFSIYDGRSVVGADAGWWLPLFARRRTTMPPQYALFNERPADPQYSALVVDLVTQLESEPFASDDAIRTMCEVGVTHAFVGQQQGLIGAGVRQLYSVSDLHDDPRFELIHQRDRAHVFEFNSGLCD